ncbi:MAG TPA: hypothetical protein VFB58_11720 [Chloroflexota bacterium]|nr:hypothetical protein [Chloroflexota bacterium]
MASCSIATTVHRVIELLVAGDYLSLERISTGQSLTPGQLAEAVREYGRTLRMPPGEVLPSLIAIFPIQDADPAAWSIDVDLWTEEEGHSDLTLQLELTESGRELCEVQIVDLHVL